MWEDDETNENEENDYDPEAHRKHLEALPIYQKAEEILEVTQHIIDTLEKDNPNAEVHSSLMLEDAMIIPAKIAGAEAIKDYVLKMENAVIIKTHARNLLTQTSSLRYLELAEPQYLQVLQNEIEAFRLLFRAWVQSFENGSIKEGDGWGLFVPDDDNNK